MNYEKAPRICPFCGEECDYDVVQTAEICVERTCPRNPLYSKSADPISKVGTIQGIKEGLK